MNELQQLTYYAPMHRQNTWIVAAFDQYENYEVLSDPWTNIIAHAPQYHGILSMDSGINGTQHKSTKATRHEMPTVMANNKSGASMA